jgi:hypothetical protein
MKVFLPETLLKEELSGKTQDTLKTRSDQSTAKNLKIGFEKSTIKKMSCLDYSLMLKQWRHDLHRVVSSPLINIYPLTRS